MKTKSEAIKKVSCPSCKGEATWSNENQYRPFCSERSKLIDLGEWAAGTYAIAQTHSEEDEVFSSMLETPGSHY